MNKREELGQAFAKDAGLHWDEIPEDNRRLILKRVDAILDALMDSDKVALKAQRIEDSYFMENLRLYLRAMKEEPPAEAEGK